MRATGAGVRQPASLAQAAQASGAGRPALRTVELAYICLGSGLLLALIFGIAGAGTIFSFLALLGGAMIPVGFVWYKARQRLRAIDDQLPDLLITLAASLKAGHSFRAGIQAVVDEGQPPASKEFNRVLTGDTARPTDGRRAGRHGRPRGLEQSLVRRHRGDDPAPGRRQPRRDLRHGCRRCAQPAAVRAEDQRIDRDGADVGLRPGRRPVLHGGHDHPAQHRLHASAVPDRDGTEAAGGRPHHDRNGLAHAPQNRQLQG